MQEVIRSLLKKAQKEGRHLQTYIVHQTILKKIRKIERR